MKTFLASLFPVAIGAALFVVFVAGPLWMSRRKREELSEPEDAGECDQEAQ